MKTINTPKTLNGSDRITEYLKRAIVLAYELSRKSEDNTLQLQDLFLAIITEKKNIASRLLEKMGVDLDSTKVSLQEDYKDEVNAMPPETSEDFRRVISEAFLYSSEMGHVYVGTEHVLLAILEFKDEPFVQDLNKVGINSASLRQLMLSFGTYQPGLFSQIADEDAADTEKQSSLGFFARDMNKLSQDGKFMNVWGRVEEIDRLIHILSRKTKNNPILVGEAGVGKTAIIEGLVQRILKNDVPYSFRGKKIIQLDLASIIAGSKIRGDVEERIIAIVKEVSADPDKVLFIDEIHMIVGAGTAGQGSMDVANILKPYLTTGDLRVIGATTFDEYQKYFETDDALTRRFQPIMVKEISKDDAYEVVKSLKSGFEKYHNIIIEEEAIKEAVELSDRYITDRYFPDKVIDIIDEAAAGKKIKRESEIGDVKPLKDKLKTLQKEKDKFIMNGDMDAAVGALKQEKKLQDEIAAIEKKKNDSKSKKYSVKPEDIKKVVSKWTKVPVESLTAQDIKSLKKLEPEIKRNLIGQDHAVKEVISALKRSKVGINDTKRPLATFMFLGPTGVGKTELAKQLSKNIFGSEEAMIQVDMSEYMEQHSVAKLIGSPPGYVGYQEGGQLTEKVRRNPYSLILFDEIEKAHPDLLNILLQVMEEGHLQDAKGRSVNFRNTIIILTSNIGAQEIKSDSILGFDLGVQASKGKNDSELDEAFEKMKSRLTDELKDTLPPEFINRLDGVIIFRSLTKIDIEKIVKINILLLQDRLQKKNIHLEISSGALKMLSEKSFNEEYGGRNVRRRVQELIENPIAELMLDNNAIDSQKGGKVKVRVEKEKIVMDFK